MFGMEACPFADTLRATDAVSTDQLLAALRARGVVVIATDLAAIVARQQGWPEDKARAAVLEVMDLISESPHAPAIDEAEADAAERLRRLCERAVADVTGADVTGADVTGMM